MWNMWNLAFPRYMYLCSCLCEAAIQENFRNKVDIRSSYQDAFFNIALRQLCWNSLKNYCDRVQFLGNLYETLSNFEPLLRNFKYFITALINAEQLLFRSRLEISSVFWKSGENFNLEELTNPMLVGCNFPDNFTVDVAMGISQNF